MNQTESQQQGTDLRLMLAQADALCMERRFDEAATIYQQLVEMAEGRLGANHPDTILVVQRLADALYAMNLFRDCLPLYEKLCKVARGMLGDGDPDVINLMFKIARTQELIGSFMEARATYQFAISTAQKHLPPGHDLTSQLQGRYEVLIERIEENKRAAQAWKENTVTNPIITIPAQGAPPSHQQQQAPPAQPTPLPPVMPVVQQAPPSMPSGPTPQSMIGQLPPHLSGAQQPWQEAQPSAHQFEQLGQPPTMQQQQTMPPQPSPPPGNPFGEQSVYPPGSLPPSAHPPGSPFGEPPSAHPPGSPFGEPPSAHPPGSPFGEPPSAHPPGSPFAGEHPPHPPGAPYPPPQSEPAPWGNSAPSPPPALPSGPPPQMQSPWDSQQQPMPGAPKPWEQPEPQAPPQPEPWANSPPPQSPAPQPVPPPMAPPRPPIPPGVDPWSSGAHQRPPVPATPTVSAIGAQLMQDMRREEAPSTPAFPDRPETGIAGLPPNMMPPGNGNSGFNQPAAPQMMPPQQPSGFPPPGGAASIRPMEPSLPPGGMPGGPPQQGGFAQPQQSDASGGIFGAGEAFRGSSAQGLGVSSAGNPFPVNDPFAGETGRRNKPDPYLEHLAAKVADLKAQAQGQTEMEAPEMPSQFQPSPVQASGWHDAISMPPVSERSQSQEFSRKRPQSAALMEGTGYGGEEEGEYNDEVEDERQVRPPTNKKIKSARAAVSKNEDLVSNVRAAKEYLIPVVVLFFIVIGGYFFVTTTTARPPVEPGQELVQPDQGEAENKVVYASPDNSIRLAVGIRDATYVDGDTMINVPCVVYDGNSSTSAMQIIDSIMERQVWFNQQPEGMVTDTGAILFEKNAPDKIVMKSMITMALTANSFNLKGGGYPTKTSQIQSQAFMYHNPFGSSGFVKLINLQESRNNRQELVNTLKTGALLMGEEKYSRGEVRCYAIADASSGTEKGVGFFVRGTDRNANFFRVRDTGEAVTLGFLDGKDLSNSTLAVDAPTKTLTATTPVKPTKIWIAKNQQLPIFVIYHSLPIFMALLAFLAFWRSLMVAPGQDPNNSANKTARIVAYIAIAIGVISAGIQYTMWM